MTSTAAAAIGVRLAVAAHSQRSQRTVEQSTGGCDQGNRRVPARRRDLARLLADLDREHHVQDLVVAEPGGVAQVDSGQRAALAAR